MRLVAIIADNERKIYSEFEDLNGLLDIMVEFSIQVAQQKQ